MTIEELKDLIDSTINENGTKAITGKALNLALNEITNAVAEAATTGGGGGGVKRLYVDISGVYNLPTFNEIIQQMQSRIEYIKSNPTGIKKEQPLKKIWFVTDKDNQ